MKPWHEAAKRANARQARRVRAALDGKPMPPARDLRPDGGPAGTRRPAVGRWLLTRGGASPGHLATRVKKALPRLAKVTAALAGVAVLSVAAVAAVVTVPATAAFASGYLELTPAELTDRIKDRRGPQLLASDGELLGIGQPRGLRGDDASANHGYASLDEPLPPYYVKAVITLEQRHLLNPARNHCGLDFAGSAMRWVTMRGGGSGFGQQTVKNLLAPDIMSPAKAKIARFSQKPVEAGVACRLYQTVGGAHGILRLYAETSPVAQGNGSTNGIVAGAWAIRGVPPSHLSPAMQYVLAAAHQLPLRLAPASAFVDGCNVLLSNPVDEIAHERRAELRAARAQCRTIARARLAARQTLDGNELAAVEHELDALEFTGIQFENDFDPALPDRQAMNMTRRAKALLGQRVLADIAREFADAERPPARLRLSLPSTNAAFAAEVERTMVAIDSGPARNTMCRRLGAQPVPMPSCPKVEADAARAHTVMARMSLVDGGVVRLYESDTLAWGARVSMGSVAKILIAIAAMERGYTAESLICPRSARIGSGAQARLLRRTTAPVHGYTDCNAAQMITIAQAMATSDSLSFLELAQRLGNDALSRVLDAVGIAPDPGVDLAYALAFGTQSATQAELLRLGQAAFAVAFAEKVASGGPRLVLDLPLPTGHVQALRRLLPDPGQWLTLREVLRAPVKLAGGTLGRLDGRLSAGKTGTTSAALRPSPESRPYVASRFILGYDHPRREVVLVSVMAPGQRALARSDLSLPALMPMLEPLLR